MIFFFFFHCAKQLKELSAKLEKLKLSAKVLGDLKERALEAKVCNLTLF